MTYLLLTLYAAGFLTLIGCFWATVRWWVQHLDGRHALTPFIPDGASVETAAVDESMRRALEER